MGGRPGHSVRVRVRGRVRARARARVRVRVRLRRRVRARVRGRRGRQACPLKRTLSTTMTPPSASSPGTVRHAS